MTEFLLHQLQASAAVYTLVYEETISNTWQTVYFIKYLLNWLICLYSVYFLSFYMFNVDLLRMSFLGDVWNVMYLKLCQSVNQAKLGIHPKAILCSSRQRTCN